MSVQEASYQDVAGQARALVLLVEDDVMVRTVIGEALREEGYEVVEAADAQEALRALQGCAPSVLVTDVNMPGPLDGIDLARRVRASRPGLWVVVMSGRAAAVDMARVADRYLQKPVRLADLIAEVRAAGEED